MFYQERYNGFEPILTAWQAVVLPLTPIPLILV